MTSLRRILCLAATLTLALAVGSSTASANTDLSIANSTLAGISNDGSQGTQYDVLSLNGNAFSFASLSSQTIDLGTLTFSDGPSTTAPAGSLYCGDFSFDITVDGSAQTFTAPYTFILNGGNHGQDDQITLEASGPLSFETAEGTILINTFATTLVGSYPGTTTAELYGQVTDVPEPASLALLGTGLIGLASTLRRRVGR